MKNSKKDKEATSAKDEQTKLKAQAPDSSNKVGQADNTVHAKEEKESIKNSK